MKKPHEQELVVSTYTVTDAFRAIPRMEAIAFKDSLGLVATTGHADDPEATEYAQLFVAAGPMALALLGVAEVGPDESVDGQHCWCRPARRSRIGSASDPLPHASYCISAREALKKAGVL